MKKILSLILVLVLALVCFASCKYLPPEVQEKVESILDKVPGFDGNKDDTTEDVDNKPHEHSFVIVKTKDPTCSLKGKNTYECSCGESKVEEFGEPLGHDFKVSSVTTPACTVDGGTKYKCTRCSYVTTEKSPATGHNFADFVEASRLIPCKNDNCSYAKMAEGNGKYKEVIVYKFTEDDLTKFDTAFGELAEIINSAAKYDASLHAYAEGSDTEAAYFVMEAKYEELYEILRYVTEQYQIAQVEYHVAMGNEQNKANYDYISEIRTDLVADFYSFSQAIYDSMFREYYYYGMTEEEIKAFIFDSNAVSDPEYKSLVDRNNEIELEFNDLSEQEQGESERVLELYSEFVENNKQIAAKLGYSNYLEYAYKNVYDRDYTYMDVKVISDYVKEFISPVYSKVYSAWNRITANLSDTAYASYLTYINDSFFSNYESNKQLNDYLDLMAFTSNENKQISFSDELNKLMSDGNLFRGQYQGAYVTRLYDLDIPIAYFGNYSYSNSFTVAHEFGHYMNEIYSGGKYSQSFDLLEMHSQGNELLYLAYLKNLDGVIPAEGIEIIEAYQILVMMDTIMNALAVDTFEQAVYTDSYEGTYADQIMADGKITKDEYDLLYESIIIDFGGEEYMLDTYWRYMTITSPCYYVSYSVSALSVLQLYPMANEDFDKAKESYLKLFTYVDTLENEEDYMTTEQTLEYAGLFSFTDIRLYKYIYPYFSSLLD